VVKALKASTQWSSFWHDDEARASIAAALNAWPGMMPVSEVFTAGGDFYRPHLILPLPQEARDD